MLSIGVLVFKMEKMSKLNFVLVTLIGTLALSACSEDIGKLQDTANQVANSANELNDAVQQKNQQMQETSENLKSGNYLAIAQDVANMQLKTSDYLKELNETKVELEEALKIGNQAELQDLSNTLKTQITGLNEVVDQLNLKSQEIDEIRSHILEANEKILASPFLNGDLNLSKENLDQIEQQIGNIDQEMIQLAAMLITSGQDDKESE